MFKTLNINIGGRLIPIDEPAYEPLSKYISWLRQYFNKEVGGNEIVQDMEDRIGEIFQNKLKAGHPSISEADVQELISIMGSPEQLAAEDVDNGYGDQQKSNPSQPKNPFQDNAAEEPNSNEPKRWYRSSKEKVIGGVCGGIAAYFNIDPAIIRVIAVLLIPIFGSTIIAYLVLMIVLPVSDKASPTLPKRFYRSEDNKFVGGVCGGIAAFFNIDASIPRLIFIGAILFNPVLNKFSTIDFSDYLNLSSFAFLTYITLWISLPKAKTLTQKMQMQGTPIDVKNITEAAKVEKDTPTKNNGFRTLTRALAYVAIGIIALMMLTFAYSIGKFWLELDDTHSKLPYRTVLNGFGVNSELFWILILLLVLLPFVALIRFVVRVSKPAAYLNKPKNRLVNILIPTVWILSLGVLLYQLSVMGRNLGEEEKITNKVQVNDIKADTVTVYFDKSPFMSLNKETAVDNGILFPYGDQNNMVNKFIDFKAIPSIDSNYSIEFKKSSYGKTKNTAIDYIKGITYAYSNDSANIHLPFAFYQNNDAAWHIQRLQINLQVPVGKFFIIKDSIKTFSQFDIKLTKGAAIIEKPNKLKANTYYLMTANGPELVGIHDATTDDQGNAEEDEQTNEDSTTEE